MVVKEFLETITKEDLLNLWMNEVYQLYNNEGHMPRRRIDEEFLTSIKDKYKLTDHIAPISHVRTIEIQEI